MPFQNNQLGVSKQKLILPCGEGGSMPPLCLMVAHILSFFQAAGDKFSGLLHWTVKDKVNDRNQLPSFL